MDKFTDEFEKYLFQSSKAIVGDEFNERFKSGAFWAKCWLCNRPQYTINMINEATEEFKQADKEKQIANVIQENAEDIAKFRKNFTSILANMDKKDMMPILMDLLVGMKPDVKLGDLTEQVCKKYDIELVNEDLTNLMENNIKNSIDERATLYAEERCGRLDYATGQSAYKQGATEQDPISRADEREKVIKKTCDILSKTGYFKMLSVEEGLSEEVFKEQIKQAMEE